MALECGAATFDQLEPGSPESGQEISGLCQVIDVLLPLFNCYLFSQLSQCLLTIFFDNVSCKLQKESMNIREKQHIKYTPRAVSS
jgi:hypothetical protein